MNNLQGINSTVDEAENHINDLEHMEGKNNQPKQQEGKRIQKNEDSIRSLWDNFKQSNTHITRVSGGENKEEEIVNLSEKIMKEKFSNLVKEIDIQVQEAQRIPNNVDTNRPTPRHIIIKMPTVENKGRLLKAAKGKQELPTRKLP